MHHDGREYIVSKWASRGVGLHQARQSKSINTNHNILRQFDMIQCSMLIPFRARMINLISKRTESRTGASVQSCIIIIIHYGPGTRRRNRTTTINYLCNSIHSGDILGIDIYRAESICTDDEFVRLPLPTFIATAAEHNQCRMRHWMANGWPHNDDPNKHASMFTHQACTSYSTTILHCPDNRIEHTFAPLPWLSME